MTTIKTIIEEFKQTIQELYEARLGQIILYGSYARGDNHEDSDIDLLIVLKDEKLDKLKEIKQLSSIASKMSLKYDTLLSLIPISELTYKTSDYLFFSIVRKEGIIL